MRRNVADRQASYPNCQSRKTLRIEGSKVGSRLNSESIDSFAPARFGLSAFPSMSLASPTGSIREQAI